jgi:hypothetical protein
VRHSAPCVWLRAGEPCLSQAARADAAALLRAALGAHGQAVSWFDASEARCGRLSHNLPGNPRRFLRPNLFCLRHSLVVARSRASEVPLTRRVRAGVRGAERTFR